MVWAGTTPSFVFLSAWCEVRPSHGCGCRQLLSLVSEMLVALAFLAAGHLPFGALLSGTAGSPGRSHMFTYLQAPAQAIFLPFLASPCSVLLKYL